MATVKTSKPVHGRNASRTLPPKQSRREESEEQEGEEQEGEEQEGEEQEEQGEPAELARIEYSTAELRAWDELDVLERIPLEDVMIKAAYGCAVIGNIVERLELKNGPGKSKQNPEGLWYAYRIELIRPLGPVDDPETGEVIASNPGDHVLMPETAKLTALAGYVGSCVGIRPRAQKALKGNRTLWLYDGVLISRERVKPGAPLPSRGR